MYVEIYSSGALVSSGAVVDNAVIASGGNNSMFVYNGGVANFTALENRGWMYVSSMGVANSTTVNDYADLYVFDGGTAHSTTLNGYGTLVVSSGGVASDVTATSGGIYVSEGTVCSATLNSGGVLNISSGGVAKSTTLNGYGNININGGGIASNTTVNGGGRAIVIGGGKADDTVVNSGGQITILGGGTANSTAINYGGSMKLSSGTANFTTVNSGGWLVMESGGRANSVILSAGGILWTFAFAEDMYFDEIVGGSAKVAENVTVDRFYMYVSSGGVVNDATMNTKGVMYVSSGGVASNTTAGGYSTMDVLSGGVAINTTVHSYGGLYVSSGGVLRGTLQITSGAFVHVLNGATIDLALADRTPEDGYLINDLSLIADEPTYVITVAVDQSVGTYKLAQGASDFTDGIFFGDGTETYGSLTVNGGAVTCDGKDYSLLRNGGDLTLTVTWNDAAVDVDDSTVISGSFFGGGENVMIGGTVAGAFFGTESASGNVRSVITGGTVGDAVIGGALVRQNQTAAIGNVTLDIAGDVEIIGGTANGGMLYTAGYAYGASESAIDASPTLTVSDSTLKLFEGSAPVQNLYAGAHARKGAYTLVGATEITVTGGTYGRVYGGGWAEKNAKSEVGSSTITVSGGSLDYLYAGGGNGPDGETRVTGGVDIAVSGDAAVNFAFLAGKNQACTIGGDVTLTLSGAAKTMTRISGYNACGVNGTEGTTTLDLQTSLDVDYLDHVDVVRIAEGKTLNVVQDLWFESTGTIRIDFDLDGVLDTDWTAMSGEGMDIYRAAQYTIDGGSTVYAYDQATGKLVHGDAESGYALSFFKDAESGIDKVKFLKA